MYVCRSCNVCVCVHVCAHVCPPQVIVTVPLAVLKNNMVAFTPPLNPRKKAAIENIGAGLVEKVGVAMGVSTGVLIPSFPPSPYPVYLHQVALLFPQPFWRNTVGNADLFGHVANSQEKRGMFMVFYDLSPRPSHQDNSSSPNTTPEQESPLVKQEEEQQQQQLYVLLTTVSGDGLAAYQKMPDSEIVMECMEVLCHMFPQEHVPDPLQSVVSRWGADPFAQMSYSYAAVGSSGEDYDTMAEDVEGRIFFAGEVM